MTFEEFTTERLPPALRFAGVLAGDRALAEDLVQEVLIRAHGRWAKIGGLDRPELYVRKMIVNQFLSWRRRSWRLVPSGAGTDVDDRTSPDHAVVHAERDALLGELGKLPRRQRAILVLRYYEGLSDQQIAEMLGCRPGTVRGYASRALAALRVELTNQPSGQPDNSPVFIEEGSR
jgi:RNA polymerase sigma-70 factor (sigma-E family)